MEENGAATGSVDDEDSNYAFNIRAVNYTVNEERIYVTIGGVQSNMTIDSGAGVNVLDRKEWERLIKCREKSKSYSTNKKIFAYGNRTPLKTLG